MRRDMNEYQNMDVLPMATAQKVKTMIIQREMKPGDRLHFTNQEKLIQNLFETRMLIEPQIAGLACQRATPQDVRNLQLLVTEMDRSEVNSPASAELDVQFHTAVAECTHNEVLIRVVPIIIESIRRSHVETHDDPESFKRAKRSHAGICKAIAEGDFMEAKFQAERHVKETEERK